MTTTNTNFKVKNGLDAVGTVTGLDLVSTASSGNEGGEIRLATAATGSTLTAGTVTIDIYQNKIRFFETGGTARGAYIDLSSATAGVGSNLLSGGSGGTTTNSLTFGTSGLIATTGTSPWNGSAAATIDIDASKVPLLASANTFTGITSITNTTETTTSSNGALIISGGLNVAKNANFNQNLYVGNGAVTQTAVTTNPIIIAKDSGATYVQTAMINSSSTGSADFAAYGDNGTDASGWVDMGFTGSAFNDTAYTITGKNDGYLFANAVSGAGLTGNLVLSTGSNGTSNDIIFGTGGFLSTNEKMRLDHTTGKLVMASGGGYAISGGLSTQYLMADGSVTTGGGGTTQTVSDTAPSSPSNGDIWVNTVTMKSYIWYDTFWVERQSNHITPETSSSYGTSYGIINCGTSTGNKPVDIATLVGPTISTIYCGTAVSF